MFDGLLNAKAVKKGICLYDNGIEHEVRIIQWHILYGSGDYEDEPEIANDKSVKCYYVWFESPLDKGVFSAGGGGFLSIKEAVLSVESTVNVQWLN